MFSRQTGNVGEVKRMMSSKRTSGQLPEPASAVGRCSTADESRAEPHAPITAGLPVAREESQGLSAADFAEAGLSLGIISDLASQNEAARAADAAACIDPSVATVLLKNGWGRR